MVETEHVRMSGCLTVPFTVKTQITAFNLPIYTDRKSETFTHYRYCICTLENITLCKIDA